MAIDSSRSPFQESQNLTAAYESALKVVIDARERFLMTLTHKQHISPSARAAAQRALQDLRQEVAHWDQDQGNQE